MRQIFLLLNVFLIFISCGATKDVGKVLRNEKTISTDEFLVKQKQPLELPPNYNEIPIPNSKKKAEPDQNNKIQSILKTTKQDNLKQKKASSVEEAIIDKIKE